MKTLIVEDDFTSRLLMQELLKGFGMVKVAVDGQEGVEAVRLALKNGEPFNLICLDIMMPELDGQQTLRVIREMEEDKGILSSELFRTLNMQASKIVVSNSSQLVANLAMT